MENFQLTGKKLVWLQHTKKEIDETYLKIFERILYNNMYEFFKVKNVISPNQSGFKLVDSCIN